MKKLTALIILLFAVSACGGRKASIYQGLNPSEDGVLASDVTDEGDSEEVSAVDSPAFVFPDDLTTNEKALIKKWHKSQESKISFIIVDAKQNKIMRSYRSETPRRLASVTKIPTALAALEHVNNISYTKVRDMLKASNNSEASRYLRLAAKAMKNFTVAGTHYTTPHNCPSSSVLRNEHPAAQMVYDWLLKEIPEAEWNGSGLKDGAGCDYGNFMSPMQLAHVLKFADEKGKAYGGMSFEELLSISGVDGTWRTRNADAKGRVLAKTGTLALNSNLSGYFYARRNNVMQKYYFTVLVEKSSSESSTNMRNMIEDLVRYWINYYNIHQGVALVDL